MPYPRSCSFHHIPKALHRADLLGNHIAQLVVPWLLFAPQPVATVAGLIIVATQSWLVVSGNFAWLNVITIVLAFSAFDDAALGRVLPIAHPALETSLPHAILVISITALVLVLSYRPARNLL